MFCPRCGKEIKPESRFCVYCGAPVTQASPPVPPAQPPSQPPPSAAYQQPAMPPQAGAAPAPPAGGAPHQAQQITPQQKRSAVLWLLVIIGVIVVSVLVLIVLFLIAHQGTKKGAAQNDTTAEETLEAEAREAEKVVRAFYDALVKKDVDKLLGLMEPQLVTELRESLGSDFKRKLAEYYFSTVPQGTKVEIREMETEVEGDRATVTITEGTLYYPDAGGGGSSVEASESGLEPLQLVKTEGKWYLTSETLADLGISVEDIQSYFSGEELAGDEHGGDEELSDLDTGEGESGGSDLTDGQEQWPLDMEVTLPIDSEQEAVAQVMKDPFVRDFYLTAPNSRVEVDDQGDHYLVHVFEVVQDSPTTSHTATCGWYAVEKDTGAVHNVVF